MQDTIIKNPQAMLDLGEKLAKSHKKILLYGNLGAGKTLFTKGFAKGLGIHPDIVQSPTYTYINIYSNREKNNDNTENKTLLHIDLYRLETYSDLIEKGILEEIHNHDYSIIERPKFEDQIDYTDFLKIEIKKRSDTERVLIFT